MSFRDFYMSQFKKLGLVRAPKLDFKFGKEHYKVFHYKSIDVFYSKTGDTYTVVFNEDPHQRYKEENYTDEEWFKETTKYRHVPYLNLPELKKSLDIINDGVEELSRKIESYTPDVEYLESRIKWEKEEGRRTLDKFLKEFRWWEAPNSTIDYAKTTIMELNKELNKEVDIDALCTNKARIRMDIIRSKRDFKYIQVHLGGCINNLKLLLQDQKTSSLEH